ncbi:hypothetical protein [Baekduia sp.]|jgi:hypothetical protein|uniref:hypothetical protein n=1 Tax=Baekduia sp. TaxID=2600305 RepID=UPI002DFF7885|nr:hypothetical protein [Baekduia sp.]
MLASADRTVRATHHVANRQVDRLLLFTALQSGTWYAHRRARRTMPRVVRGTAVSSGLVAAVAVGTGLAVVRHRLGLDDGHGRGNGAPVAPPAP